MEGSETPNGATDTLAAAQAIAERSMAESNGSEAPSPGAPDPGTSAVVEPAAPTPPAAPEAPAAAPAEAGDQGFDAPFNINDVPAEYREHVERYQKQLQGAFTQKTQELSTERSQLGEWVERLQILNGDDREAKIALYNELLDPLGFELPSGEADEEFDDGTQPPAGDAELVGEAPEGSQLPPELTEALEFLMGRELQRAAQERTQQEDTARENLTTHVEGALEKFGQGRGYEAGEDGKPQIPGHVRDAILSRAIALPKGADGMPDMTSAIAAYEAWEAAAVQEYVNRKGGATPAVPDASGVTGQTQQFDLSTDEGRRQKALSIVGRHL